MFRHKTKVITPSVTWRTEAWKKKVIDDVLCRTWKVIINQTSTGTVSDSEASLGKLLRCGGAHMGFPKCIDTILNCSSC